MGGAGAPGSPSQRSSKRSSHRHGLKDGQKYHDPIPKGFEFERKSMKALEQLMWTQEKEDHERDVYVKPQGKTSVVGSKAFEVAGPPKSNAEIVWALSKTYKLPVDDLAKLMKHFQQVDVNNQGTINLEQFQELVTILIHFGLVSLEKDIDVRELTRHYHIADADESGEVDIEEFVRWYVTNLFNEDLTVTCEEREIRQFAADCGLEYKMVESIFHTFKGYDTDGNGVLDKDEFKQALCKLLRIKDTTMLSNERVTKLWDEVDTDKSGEITFIEFLPWYCQNFMYFDSEGNLKDQLSTFYRSFRRVAGTSES
jgi:Ca2+-binding EF-hand superfamily protein